MRIVANRNQITLDALKDMAQGNNSRGVNDPALRERIRKIVDELVSRLQPPGF